MKKISSTEAELKKSVTYKKTCNYDQVEENERLPISTFFTEKLELFCLCDLTRVKTLKQAAPVSTAFLCCYGECVRSEQTFYLT